MQFQKFNWLFYRTTEFDVYFYPTGRELANYTIWKAPEFISELEKMFNFTNTKKIQFIVYNTQSDFRESNFGLEDDNFYNQGGVTNIHGSKIYLYFDGNHSHFDCMMKAGIANIFARNIIEGQSVGSNISSDYLIEIPEWFYNGLASYIGKYWDSDVDYHVKSGILSLKYGDLDMLSKVDATYAGHSFWKFIADRYGLNAISNILYTTRTTRSFEKAFYYVTGVTYDKLLQDWFRYFYVIYKKESNKNSQDGNEWLNKYNSKYIYSQIITSLDGKSFAFMTNEFGQIKIHLKTPDMKKTKVVVKLYHKTEDNPDLSFPILGWHPNGNIIGYTVEDRGRCYYYPYNIKDNKKGERQLIDVEKITSWNYNKDGNFILFSGFKNGQSDIFLYGFRSHSYQYITNDIFDDYQPQFLPNQKDIVFASNRTHDTLKTGEKFYENTISSKYNLFLYHYNKKDKILLRITDSKLSDETSPIPFSDNQLLYLSDILGITNRYLAKLDSSITTIDTVVHYEYYAKSKLITNNSYSILEQNFNKQSNQISDLYLIKGKYNILKYPLTLDSQTKDIDTTVFMLKTIRKYLYEDSIKNINNKEKSLTDKKQTHGFYQLYFKDILTQNGHDEDNTEFVKDNIAEKRQDSILFKQPVAQNYYVQYSLNKLATQLDFSFLNTSYQQFTNTDQPIYLNNTFNAFFLVGIQDLFENHRITGGVRFSFDISSNEFVVSYENLSHRLDHEILLYRQSINYNTGYDMIKLRSNSAFYIMKYPFTKYSSIKLTLTGRYETSIVGSIDQYSLKEDDRHAVWEGAKLEYIFDSSKDLYTNLWHGYKIKLFAEYEQQIFKEYKNLFVLGFDIRKSVRVYRNMVWATRVAGSTNFGSSRLIYYMGGIDNWLFAKFNRNISVDKNAPYVYQTLATNLRGFEQNIRNGNSFVVLNTELRIPFIQLINKKLSSNILNSLQLVVFGDAGTAWTGLTPYSEDNALYRRYIESGPITAIVRRNVDPFVGGFGLGLRASLLGYFCRLDYSWGIEGGKLHNPKGMIMLSIGLDF